MKNKVVWMNAVTYPQTLRASVVDGRPHNLSMLLRSLKAYDEHADGVADRDAAQVMGQAELRVL